MRLAMKLGVMALTGVTGVVGLATPAIGKGIESMAIDGPGLAEPVVLQSEGTKGAVTLLDDAGRPVDLVDELNPWAVMGDPSVELMRGVPVPDLGPAYEVSWRMYGATSRVEQVLYPFAGGGPLIHIPAEPIWDYDTRDTWYRVPDTVLETLTDLGVIAATDSHSGRSYAVIGRTATTSSASGDSPWPVAVIGATAAMALASVGGAVAFRRSRARRRERVAPVPL